MEGGKDSEKFFPLLFVSDFGITSTNIEIFVNSNLVFMFFNLFYLHIII